jgi:hypothetical protein
VNALQRRRTDLKHDPTAVAGATNVAPSAAMEHEGDNTPATCLTPLAV